LELQGPILWFLHKYFRQNIGSKTGVFDTKTKQNYEIRSKHWFLRKTPIFSPKNCENR
jgi:phage/plasmid-associated DNA primase